MKIKIIMLMLFLTATLSIFVGCAECISTEYNSVEVTIVDEYYHGAWIQPVFTGKSIINVPHPAEYRIKVSYYGEEYTINDSATYNKYKDKVGEVANGTLEIKTYDDGSVRYNIIALD